MRKLSLILFACALVLLVVVPSASAQGVNATDRAVRARKVARRIVVSLYAVGETKEIRYRVDDENDSIGMRAADTLFSTSTPLLVTYPQMNPFAIQATASITEADDPTQAALAQLVSTIAGIPGLIDPTLVKAAGAGAAPRRTAGVAACAELTSAEEALRQITVGLYGSALSASSLVSQYKGWSDGFVIAAAVGGGPAAAREAASSIERLYSSVRTDANAAEAAIKQAQERFDDPVAPTQKQLELAQYLADLIKDKDAAAQAAALAEQKAEIGRRQADADASVACAQDARDLYRLIVIAAPQARLADVRRLEKALADLRTVMQGTFGNADNWFNEHEYVLAKDVMPAAGKVSRVSVKASSVKLETSEASIRTSQQEAAAAAFEIREHTKVGAELGVGATFAVLERPKYGTALNAAGQTVVALAGSEEVKVAPTVMINLVPVGVSGAVPIFQLGASAVEAGPTVFAGAGWRVPGTGTRKGLVFGVGLVIGWVKDLNKLVPGESVVTGTKDIEADLRVDPRPRTGWYLNLQYKF